MRSRDISAFLVRPRVRHAQVPMLESTAMGATADIDQRHLARAIELAESGRGRVSPNPMVGAVITRDDEILGEGFHGSLGGPHAEVEAILAASDHDLSGATMYVSLEPCCHQ